ALLCSRRAHSAAFARGRAAMRHVKELLTARRTGPVDPVLAAAVVGLMGFGVVMVYSASLVEAVNVFRDPAHFLKRQAVFAGAALALMFVVCKLDYTRLRPLTYVGLLIVIGMMVLSVAGFGHTGGGAARWRSEERRVGRECRARGAAEQRGEQVR